ncbi:MAG: hypothetical protein E7231_08460 [Cellulosilyticum sp.]|nr:hypothetical protein [Cellulosilyticum sp.]
MNTSMNITYYPSLRAQVGSINAALLVAHLERCFTGAEGKSFFKFMEPCGDIHYVEGQSWVEEMQMTGTEFRTAFRHIGIVYKSKNEYNRSKDKFQGKMYLSYYDRIRKLTFYMRNDDLVNRILENVIEKEKEGAIQEIQMDVPVESINDCLENEKYEMRDSGIEESEDGIIDYKTIVSHTNPNNNRVYNKTKTNNTTVTHNINNSAVNDRDAENNLLAQESLDIMITQLEDTIEPVERKKVKTDNESKGNMKLSDEIAFERIRILFNQVCHFHTPIMHWSQHQKQKLRMLWNKYEQEIEVFKRAFEKLEESDFLSGRVKSWKAQIDWIFKPIHFADILADRYKNYEKSKVRQKRCWEGMLSHDWNFDEIERLEQERINKRLGYC